LVSWWGAAANSDAVPKAITIQLVALIAMILYVLSRLVAFPMSFVSP
jgi:hypothetical protein